METSINQPHENSAPDEAELFFGTPEDSPPDPGDFNPETGDFSRSAEKMEAEGERYREERGEAPSESTQSAETTARLAAAEADQDDTLEQQERLRAISAKRQAEEVPVTDDTPADADEKKRGPVTREYIVFQQVDLTHKVLEHLMGKLTSGENPEPVVAFVELHRSTARTDKLALTEAYSKHKDSLGKRCELAAVSARQFKTRRVQPRAIVKNDVEIT
jgi:hypothetical protein